MAAVFRRCVSCLNLGKPLVLRKSGNLPSFSGSNKGKIFFSASWIKNILFRHRVSNDRTHFQGFSNPFEFQSLYTKLLNWSALRIDFAINLFWAKEGFVSKSMNPPDFLSHKLCSFIFYYHLCKRFLFREVLIVLILHLSIHIGNVFRSHISTEPQRVHLDHFSNQGGNFSKTKSIIFDEGTKNEAFLQIRWWWKDLFQLWWYKAKSVLIQAEIQVQRSNIEECTCNLARDDNCKKSENVQILMKSPAIFPSQSQRVLFTCLAAHAIQKKYVSLARAWYCIKLITLHCMIISPVWKGCDVT